jgi:hypothetical protein
VNIQYRTRSYFHVQILKTPDITPDSTKKTRTVRANPGRMVILVMAYLQVSPLGGTRDETWRGQGIRKHCVLEFAETESIVTVQRRFRTKYQTYELPYTCVTLIEN